MGRFDRRTRIRALLTARCRRQCRSRDDARPYSSIDVGPCLRKRTTNHNAIRLSAAVENAMQRKAIVAVAGATATAIARQTAASNVSNSERRWFIDSIPTQRHHRGKPHLGRLPTHVYSFGRMGRSKFMQFTAIPASSVYIQRPTRGWEERNELVQ